MFDNYIIEIRPASLGVTVQAGLVVRDNGGFRFFAASRAFDRLDGQLFASARAAERAAALHMANLKSSNWVWQAEPEADVAATG